MNKVKNGGDKVKTTEKKKYKQPTYVLPVQKETILTISRFIQYCEIKDRESEKGEE